MNRTTISIDKELTELVRKQAAVDHISVSVAFSLLARAYAEKRIRLGAHVHPELEVEILEVSPSHQAKMDRIASML